MSTLRILVPALVTLITACATEAPIDSLIDDSAIAEDGKADGSVNLEWCKEVAGEYARKLYNDFKDFEILETTVATVVDRGPGFLWIQTDSAGHGSESTDFILMSTACYPIGSLDVIEDEYDAVFYARRAASAAKAHVLIDWDFDRILASELRWPITNQGVVVDVRVLDGGHDEGSFAVTLSSSGKVIAIEETQPFTP